MATIKNHESVSNREACMDAATHHVPSHTLHDHEEQRETLSLDNIAKPTALHGGANNFDKDATGRHKDGTPTRGVVRDGDRRARGKVAMPDDIYMITPTQQMISSTIGALTTSIFVTPLDVVKIRLQAQQKDFFKNKCFLYCNGLMEHLCYCVNGNGSPQGAHIHHPNGTTIEVDPRDIKWYKRPLPGHFTGTFDALIKISRTEGLGSLWSGLPPTLLMAIPATVIYFTAYDRLRVNLWSWCESSQQPIWIPVVCGAAARCIAATTISPLEMVRTKMQSKKLSYWEVATAIKQLVKFEGPLSLWRGLGPTLLRDVPFSSIYWASYEFMKQRLDQRKPTLQFSLTAGAIAGSIAAVATLPFDVAKTHRQIELGERDLIDPAKRRGLNNSNDHRTSAMLKKIYKQSGVPGLFSGVVPRVIKVAPSCAIMITCYEYGKQFFVKYNSEKADPRVA